MKSLLITGGNGFIGRHLVNYFRRKLKVVSTDKNCHGFSSSNPIISLDITNKAQVINVIDTIKPNFLIHAAGNKNVKYCEMYPEEAWNVNVIGTENLAMACKEYNVKFLYLSTDYVFEGTKGKYKEIDETKPKTVYGKTKLEGEYRIKDILSNYGIYRSAAVYSYGSVFLTWITEELSKAHTIKAYFDSYNSPTYILDLCNVIEKIMTKDHIGTLHTAGPERISRYDFIRTYCEIFNHDKSLVKPVKRPKNSLFPADSSLSTEEAQVKLGVELSCLRNGLKNMKEGEEEF